MEQGHRGSTGTGHALPMVIAPQEKDTAHLAPRPRAAFLAQLLATRQIFAGQALRRNATGDAATRAYAATRAITTRRLPAGYRRTLDA